MCTIRYYYDFFNCYCFNFRYLETKCTFMELHFAFKCGVSTVTEIVKETCKVIWNKLQRSIIPKPNKDAWIKIFEGFQKHLFIYFIYLFIQSIKQHRNANNRHYPSLTLST